MDHPYFMIALEFAALIVVATILRQTLIFVLDRVIGRLLRLRGVSADKKSIHRVSRPVGSLLFVLVLAYGLDYVHALDPKSREATAIVIRALAALCAVVLLYRLVDLGASVAARRAEATDTKLDDQLIPLVRTILHIAVVAVGVIFILQNLDVDVTSLLALGTVGTLAVSLAAKDTVENFFGSIGIFADRPFQVGDWVVVGDIEGVVEQVGMRSTRIRTFYNSLVSLPNSKVVNTPVDNYGVRDFRRQTFNVSLTYDTSAKDMTDFCEGVRKLLREHPGVRKDLLEVHFKNMSESSLDVMVYFFLNVDTWSEELAARHAILLQIMTLAEQMALSFAFPTRTLHLEKAAA